MMNMKKKFLIATLALAMVTSTSSFAMLHGEGDNAKIVAKNKAITKKRSKLQTTIPEKKAIYLNGNRVTGRNEDGTTDNTDITNLETITDLMISDNVLEVTADRFKDLTNLTKLTFKDASTTSKVTKIRANAFKGTGITNIELPKNLTDIEDSAFADTTALTTVDFSNSINLRNIKRSAFENSGLTTVDLSPMDRGTNGVLLIGEDAFKGNRSLVSVTLSTKMIAIKAGTFASTKITSIEILDSISKVDPLAFVGTPLSTLTVSTRNAIMTAEDNVLYNHDKTSLEFYPAGKADKVFTIPSTVTDIKANAFHSSPYLTEVIVGQALVSIGESAFANAIKLTTLDVRKAAALSLFSEKTFDGSGLESMIIGARTSAFTTIEVNAFNSIATNRKVFFKDDRGEVITGDKLTALELKYASLKEPANGSWVFSKKFSTPTATIDYNDMNITGLVPSAPYIIDMKEYTADTNGNIKLLKIWGGKTISIVKKASLDHSASDAQNLPIDKIYTVSVDGINKGLKKEGASVTVEAIEKKGHVFTLWVTTDLTLSDATQKNMTFSMPANDVNLATEYTEITVTTPVSDLLFDGKKDVVVTIISPFSNFEKLAVNNTDLTKNTDYTVNGINTTVVTLKKSYLDTLTDTTTFTATFQEGGEITFSVRLYGSAPAAMANYSEMKLTGLEANAQYKINNVGKTTDTNGKIAIEKSWSSQTLEIIKVGTGTEPDSKPQSLPIQALYTIQVNGQEFGFTTAGTEVTLTADKKQGYRFKEWKATGLTLPLPDALKETITFRMPTNDVVLEPMYELIITTKPEEMVYDGTNPLTIRFSIPMAEFQNIEYNGKTLIKGYDYTVVSGSTIVTFTTSFLDKMGGDMNGIQAIFTSGPVEFSIKFKIPALPVPVKPGVGKPNTTTEQHVTNRPKTGDNTNMIFLFTTMLLSAGAFLYVKKRKKQ